MSPGVAPPSTANTLLEKGWTKLNRRDALPPEVQPRGAPEDEPDVAFAGSAGHDVRSDLAVKS